MFAAACGVGDGDDEGEIVPPDPNPLKAVCNAAFTTQGSFVEGAGRPIDDNDTPADTTDDFPVTGCYPVGEWKFTTTIDAAAPVPDITGDKVGDRCGEGGTTAPTVLPEFSFRVERVDAADGSGKIEKYFAKIGGTEYNMSDDTDGDKKPDGLDGANAALGLQIVRLKVSSDGGGDCEGTLEFFDNDFKKYWNVHPSQAGAVITGQGQYTEYQNPQPRSDGGA